MPEWIRQPWPWYAGGILIGLTVPALLLLGNKHFGISANLRHMCAALFPSRIPFFRYDWKKERWNLFFSGGIVAGAFLATVFLAEPAPVVVHPALAEALRQTGVTDFTDQVPRDLFSFASLLTLRGFVLIAGGGFLVGFGTRYAGGCTSGHAIMGLSDRQWPSLVATVSFMAGGFFMSNAILPYLLKL